MVMRGSGLPFSRRGRRSWRGPAELVAFSLYFLCTVLLVLSRIGHGTIAETRDALADFTAPLLELASAPVAEARHAIERVRTYAGLFAELDRLKRENAGLKEWEWRAKMLEQKVEHLHALLNAVDEPGLNFATGRVIADARGPFVRSALINLGRDQGVRVGYAVISGDGLVGRTVDAGTSVSRVLLLNDLNSRIPVLVGPAAVRGLVAGDNSAELRLEFLPDGAEIFPGDEVYTSGSDGVLPRGLRVGAVAGTAPTFRVHPHAALNDIDFVSVLFFDTPALISADPAAASASPQARALSSKPQGLAGVARPSAPPPSVPPVTAEARPIGVNVKHAGADDGSAAVGGRAPAPQ
jgi:rod shape-determining protein MreC